jgi:hypothetical protein
MMVFVFVFGMRIPFSEREKERERERERDIKDREDVLKTLGGEPFFYSTKTLIFPRTSQLILKLKPDTLIVGTSLRHTDRCIPIYWAYGEGWSMVMGSLKNC